MRKITTDAYNAFINNKRFKLSNTEVRIEDGETAMYLFGNKIVETQEGETFISAGGHKPSRTTRERLNAFPEVWLSINKSKWVIANKISWDGKWTNINKFEEVYER
jgi:hypothetical protein